VRLEEFDAFKGELKQLCATLGKAYTDALGEAYWRSLRDVALDEVQAHVERILLNATAETKFPKPSSLRNAPRKEAPTRDNPQNYDLRQRSLELHLEELDALKAWHLLDSYLARCDVEEEPDSVFYAERIAWCKQQARKLYDRHGPKWCVADRHCMHVASRLLGGEYIHAQHNRLWDKQA
jgi:hypothetical protein